MKHVSDVNHPRISKSELSRIVQLHTQALTAVAINHPMYSDMHDLLQKLKMRLDTYDDFANNPYKTHTSVPKYNSDVQLGLGDYDIHE